MRVIKMILHSWSLYTSIKEVQSTQDVPMLDRSLSFTQNSYGRAFSGPVKLPGEPRSLTRLCLEAGPAKVSAVVLCLHLVKGASRSKQPGKVPSKRSSEFQNPNNTKNHHMQLVMVAFCEQLRFCY